MLTFVDRVRPKVLGIKMWSVVFSGAIIPLRRAILLLGAVADAQIVRVSDEACPNSNRINGWSVNPLVLRQAQHERIPRTPTDFLG